MMDGWMDYVLNAEGRKVWGSEDKDLCSVCSYWCAQ
jgi:hypothetical protein